MPDRELRKEVSVDATPEQAWEAIATGPGIAGWFVPHTVEGREGGRITQDHGGGMEIEGVVTAWEPVRRFAYGPVVEAEPHYAFEFLVEAREGAATVVRLVQSGFLDGDAEYGGFDTGWGLFLHNLAQYLTHFLGQPVTNVVTAGYVAEGARTLWPKLHRALGLDAHPAVGETVTLRPDGLAPITGIVDVADAAFLGVRSPHGLHRIGAEGETGCGISAYHYLYGPPIDASALTADWQAWLDRAVPAS